MANDKQVSCLADDTARFIALIMVWISLNAMGFTVLFHEPPSTMRDIIIALMGSLSTIFVQQVQYYNKTGVTNDRQKDDTINKLTTTAASIQAATSPLDIVAVKPGETKTVVGTDDIPSA